MLSPADPPASTLPERALLRHEFLPRFGQAPLLADGIRLRTWRGGPQAGQPKLPPAVASMLARGLVALGQGRKGPQVYFTKAGYVALLLLVQDRRALSPSPTPTSARSSSWTQCPPVSRNIHIAGDKAMTSPSASGRTS